MPAFVLNHDADVYFLLTPPCELPTIERTLRFATSISPPWLACLARSSGPPVHANPTTFTRSELEEASHRTEQILVGAYDGESFLRWRRQ